MGYFIMRAVIRVLLPLQVRVRASHAERCPPTGALIIVANHLGVLDPVIIGSRVRRRIRILAKAELFQWFVLGGLARFSGVVPVRRGASDREALQILARALAAGECIHVMPEGTYPKVPLPPAMLRAKTGAAFLAAHSGARVLPVAITGTERVWTPARGWRPWHRPRVTVTFGEPYLPAMPKGLSTKDGYQAMADEMGRRIAALLPEAYRGVYGDAEAGKRSAAGAEEAGAEETSAGA